MATLLPANGSKLMVKDDASSAETGKRLIQESIVND